MPAVNASSRWQSTGCSSVVWSYGCTGNRKPTSAEVVSCRYGVWLSNREPPVTLPLVQVVLAIASVSDGSGTGSRQRIWWPKAARVWRRTANQTETCEITASTFCAEPARASRRRYRRPPGSCDADAGPMLVWRRTRRCSGRPPAGGLMSRAIVWMRARWSTKHAPRTPPRMPRASARPWTRHPVARRRERPGIVVA